VIEIPGQESDDEINLELYETPKSNNEFGEAPVYLDVKSETLIEELTFSEIIIAEDSFINMHVIK
jgi:hypothetical protein